MRQRLYNPAQLSSSELKASFIARQETLEELHRIIREEKPGRPCQHFLLIRTFQDSEDYSVVY